MKDPFEGRLDHDEDKTSFEIAFVDKHNHAMCIDCVVENGKIHFNKVRIYEENGMQQSQRTWLDKTLDRQREYYGPKFYQLSEPVQNGLVEALYEAGVHPELGLCLEYLSWNKEQRIYLDWLSQMFFNFYAIGEQMNRPQIEET